MTKTIEQKYIEVIMKEENAQTFALFNRLTNNLFSDKATTFEEKLALKSQINNLEKTITEHKKEIANLILN